MSTKGVGRADASSGTASRCSREGARLPDGYGAGSAPRTVQVPYPALLDGPGPAALAARRALPGATKQALGKMPQYLLENVCSIQAEISASEPPT